MPNIFNDLETVPATVDELVAFIINNEDLLTQAEDYRRFTTQRERLFDFFKDNIEELKEETDENIYKEIDKIYINPLEV